MKISNYLKAFIVFCISIGLGFACHYVPEKSIIEVMLGLGCLASLVLSVVLTIMTLFDTDPSSIDV